MPAPPASEDGKVTDSGDNGRGKPGKTTESEAESGDRPAQETEETILPGQLTDDEYELTGASDGRLYFTTLNGVIRYDGVSFTDISPDVPKRVCNALDVDPTNPDRIIVCRNNTGPDDCMNMNIYLTEDGGRTWTQKNSSIRKLDKLDWWPGYYWSSATSTLCFNPKDTKEVWLADWYGVWATCNINDETVDWYSKVRGHEEFVTFDMMTLPAGPVKLLVGSVDNGRLCYTDLTKNPPDRSGSDCRDLAYSYGNPNFVIQASSSPVLLISEDYGKTWELVINDSKLAVYGQITGDMQVYGRCFLSSGGVGVIALYK